MRNATADTPAVAFCSADCRNYYLKNTLSYNGDRRGFAPHPTRGMIPLDPAPGEEACMDLSSKRRLLLRNYER